ncbi:MAG: lysylphosphatidylglycerol synthase domain-containing protein, partial [Alkalispirochaetaceae bacterium]
MRKIARRAVRLLLGGGRLVLFAAALWTLYIELGRFPTDRLIEPLSALSGLRIAGVVGLLLLSYLMASVTEALAGRYGGIRLRPGRATLAALITVGITNSASFGLLTGSGLRYRLYNAWGLTAFTTTKVLVFTTTTFALGYSVLTGVGLLSLPGGYTLLPWVPEALHLPAGAVLLASLPAYVLFALRYRAGLRFFGIRLSPPKPGEAALQALAGVAAWFAGATLLFLLLPSFGIESYGVLLTAYGIAILAGIVSGLPGGIGVFDALFILILSRSFPVPELASALLAYRLIYFVVPLFIGLALLFRRERITEAPKLSEGTLRFGRRVRSVLPSLMTLAVFLSGVLLLLSGATPGRPARIAGILSILPLPVLEASHSLASVLGLMLLFLARGLQRRLLVAWVMTVALLLSATAATALRGGGLEVTAVMATTLISLLASKRDFYRRSRIVSAPLPGGWIAAIILVLLTTGWLTVFANRPVALNRFLWLEVSPESDVARSLRALGGAVAVAALLFIVRAVGHRIVPRPGEPTAE